eukprot:CAMPEP_0174262474 /NCGR_PEP_ID=MMETSP0439-20130205/12994_1 /TAXON_ID=0 /ORGANISM="Stereomyxa ramosa, Strain Chinc5" /LENGTH=184 /DNA_ID=CAMNT_0015347187 /DNA_START=188 /DNA_END=742 /DNA_ORIENTATION=+
MTDAVREEVQKKMSRKQQIELLGEYKEYYSNGQLRKLQHYKDGKEHGICLKWWSNGSRWHQKHCVHGQLVGKRKLWYKNGQLKWYAHYANFGGKSVVHGECKWWHSNGELRSQAYYENDRLHGEFKFWTDKGKLCSEGYYFNGCRLTGWFASMCRCPRVVWQKLCGPDDYISITPSSLSYDEYD